MPDSSDPVTARLTALSQPAWEDLLMFLQVSASIPGRTDTDENAYFEALTTLRRQADAKRSN